MVAVVAILDVWSEWRSLFFFIYKSHRYCLSSYKSIGLSVQEKKFKTDFPNGGHDDRLGFQIRMMLAISDLQATLSLLPSFKSSQENKFKIDFQNGGWGSHLVIEMILAIFYL